MINPYNALLFSLKKEISADLCYGMDEPWKHSAQWEKPVMKGHLLCDSIYMKCPKQAYP